MSLVRELEAILFVADRPASLAVLQEITEQEPDIIRRALSELQERLDQGSALQLIEISGGFQLSTRPEHEETVRRFLKPAQQRFGRSLMEVLAIIAYRQPVTLAEVDAVRGVHSDYGLRQLLERHLIREVGRKSTPGRPVLYGTTQQFLHQFKMNSLDELPELEVVSELDPAQLSLPLEMVRPALVERE